MRVVMIEVGHWHATMHLRSLRLAGAEIVGVSDRQPGVAARFAAEIGCPAYADHRERCTCRWARSVRTPRRRNHPW